LITYEHIKYTPLVRFRGQLSDNRCIWLKDETHQHTRAFKFRGVASKLSMLLPGTSVITASTGNHGIAVATAAKRFSLHSYIFIPTSTPVIKRDSIITLDASVHYIDGLYDDSEMAARAFAKEIRGTFVSSFDDPQIIEGHGTLFNEINIMSKRPDALFVPVGGGGLISACLNHLKGRDIQIYAVELDTAPKLAESLRMGRRVYLSEANGRAEGLLVRQVGQIALTHALSTDRQSR